MIFERRTVVEGVEFRATPDGKKVKAAGYAAVFNKRSQNLGGFVEVVAPGAFKKTLQEQDVRALFNHDPNALLGRSGSGTLTIEEDETGLAYEVTLPDTTVGRDVANLLERGDLAGSSFGFRTIEDDWGETEEEFPLRTLKAVSLRDVGPVVFPAYSDSSSALRSLAEARSLNLEDLVKAAELNTLRSFLEQPQGEEDGREPPTVIYRRLDDWIV